MESDKKFAKLFTISSLAIEWIEPLLAYKDRGYWYEYLLVLLCENTKY